MLNDVFKNHKKLKYDLVGKRYGGKYIVRLELAVEAVREYLLQYKELGYVYIKNREKNADFDVRHYPFSKVQYLNELLQALQEQLDSGGKGEVKTTMSFDYTYEKQVLYYTGRKPDRNAPDARICYIYKYKGIYLKLIRRNDGRIQALSFHDA